MNNNNKITIGLFVDVFFPMTDGVVMVVDNYAKRLSKYCNVIVFAPKFVGHEYDDSKFNYKVVRCISLKVPFLDYTLPIPKMDIKFQKELKQYNLDLVHIHSPFTVGEAGIKYAIDNNIPLVGTMHSQYKRDLLRAVKTETLANQLLKPLISNFNKCDECWAVNSEVARIFYEDYGYKELPKVMNNATEMKPINNSDLPSSNKYINKIYNLSDEKVFIFVGRINALKNIFFIVDALKLVKEKDPNLKFKMLFVGSGQDEEELKKVIKKYNLEDNIIMCGKITDRKLLASLYARSDLFLFPSLYDSSSIVQIEAASQHTPVLFIEGAATTATVTNNVNGFIAPNNIEKYANYIINIMHNDKLLNDVSNNCYRDLYKNWDDTIESVYNNYLELINKKKDNDKLLKKIK
jgi:glycosyltransferase involved in cell wall biosynthesis